MTYIIRVQNQAGDVLGELNTYKDLKFGKRLNNYSMCEFSIPVDDLKSSQLVSLRRYSVYIYRVDGSSEDLVWSGEQALRKSNLQNNKNNWSTITCYDWFEQLGQRYIQGDALFTGIDAGTIAWTLIDDAQAISTLGIIEGDINATTDRDRYYEGGENIAETILNLSNVIDGFDFEINNLKRFNVYSQIGVDRSEDVILEYGKNISSIQITEDYKNPVNSAIMYCENDDGTTLSTTVDDAGLQALYGLRELRQSELNISDITTLQEKGESIIRKRGLPLVSVEIDLVPNSFPSIVDVALGDTVTLVVDSGIYNIKAPYRIYEWNLEYGTDNSEKLQLLLSDFI